MSYGFGRSSIVIVQRPPSRRTVTRREPLSVVADELPAPVLLLDALTLALFLPVPLVLAVVMAVSPGSSTRRSVTWPSAWMCVSRQRGSSVTGAARIDARIMIIARPS
jgi:hypothetical protein